MRYNFDQAIDYKVGNVRARLATTSEQDNCITNPVIKMTSNNGQSDTVDGNRRFKISLPEATDIVLYFRVPASRIFFDKERMSQEGEYDLVIDHLTIGPDLSVNSKYGVAPLLYQIETTSDHVTLVRKEKDKLSFFCADHDMQIEASTKVVLDSISSPITVGISYALGELDTNLADPDLIQLFVADTFDIDVVGAANTASQEYSFGVGTLQSIRGVNLSEWQTSFRTMDQKWDLCTSAINSPVTPTSSEFPTTFQCKSGGLLEIANRKFVRTPESFDEPTGWNIGRMFRRHSPELLMFQLGTVPPEAEIMVEGERQAKKTNTAMEIYQNDLHNSIFYKTGFKPCPFAEWKILEVRKPRTQYEAKCILKPIEKK